MAEMDKTFTQEEVDKMINDRLARERKKFIFYFFLSLWCLIKASIPITANPNNIKYPGPVITNLTSLF